ncbi:MAG TPA: hypothetical protein VKP60_07545, partial [Magnetospirillaceae bacterium]|nr:hypothetical protein [Magnetospirillaceae bacterium]
MLGGGAYYFFSAGTQNSIKQQLDQALQRLPPGWTAGYKSIDVGLAARSLELKGFELHGTGSTKLDLAIDKVDVSDLSLDFLSFLTKLPEAAAHPETLGPDQAMPIADAIAATGATLRMNGQEFRLGSGHVDKPRVYLWALLHPGVPSYGEVLKLVQHPDAVSQPEEMLPVLRFEAAAMLGVAEDSYDFQDMSGKVTVALPDKPATDATYAIRKLSGSGIDRGKMASAVADGMAVKTGPGGDVTIDHLAITGLDARDVLTRALTATTFDPAMVDGLTLAKLEYSGLTARPPQPQPPITLGSVTVSDLAFAHGLLVSGEFSVAGFKVSRAQMTDDQA